VEPFFEDYLNLFQRLHQQIKMGISGLPDQALNWKPGPDMNSIGVLITHLIGAQRYWARDVILQKPSTRDRESEFKEQAVTERGLARKLDDSLEGISTSFEELKAADLEKIVYSSRRDGPCRAGWAIAHALEHTALHLGHIQITRQMWEMHADAGSG
jgi:uncharacterized damage-inducible protein DinB